MLDNLFVSRDNVAKRTVIASCSRGIAGVYSICVVLHALLAVKIFISTHCACKHSVMVETPEAVIMFVGETTEDAVVKEAGA